MALGRSLSSSSVSAPAPDWTPWMDFETEPPLCLAWNYWWTLLSAPSSALSAWVLEDVASSLKALPGLGSLTVLLESLLE